MVTVVVPSYNHARFLKQCLTSVVEQTHADWELLIIDDGSSDESVSIANAFAADDWRIKVVVNERNLGAYATQNRGIHLAGGDWIAILNSDDYWAPDKLAGQMALLEAHPESAFCYARGTVVDESGVALPVQDHHRDYPPDSLQNVLPWLFHTNQVLASSLVFRKGAVTMDERMGYSGDWVAALRLAQASQACFVNESVVFWRQHGENSSKKLAKILPEEVSVRQWIVENGEGWLSGAPEDLQRLGRLKLDWTMLELGAHLFVMGETSRARSMFRRAMTSEDQTLRRTATKRFVASYGPRSYLLRRFGGSLELANLKLYERVLSLKPT